MTKKFRHGVIDGWIAITNDDTETMFPYSWWITQEPSYTLASQYNYREYLAGVNGYHRVNEDGMQLQAPEGFPWLDGDTYISKKSIYEAAYAAYINVPLTLEQVKAIKFNDLLAKYAEVRSGKVTYGLVNYLSNNINYGKLFSECYLYTGLGSVPIGYYILDEDRNQVSSVLADLQAIIVLIQKLHHECSLTYDIHYDAISALTDIALVESYDITTGWPTVPYTG